MEGRVEEPGTIEPVPPAKTRSGIDRRTLIKRAAAAGAAAWTAPIIVESLNSPAAAATCGSLAFQASGTTQTWTMNATKSVALPAGVASSDLLVMIVVNTFDNGATTDITTATVGWTKQVFVANNIAGDNDLQLAVFTAAGSAASPSVAINTAHGASARIVSYREGSCTPTWDTSANASGTAAASTSVTPTGISTTVANSMALSIVADRASGASLSLSSSQSFTIRYTDAPTSLLHTVGLADRLVAIAGAVTSPTWSSGATSASWVFDSAAIKP
jgi:hypothetical protein